MSFIETAHSIQSSSHSSLFNINNTYRFIAPHHLLICTYHRHPCSTQQPFYEVEIIYFPVIFVTQQTVYDVGVISRSDSVLNSNSTKQVISSWIFDVFIIQKTISAVSLSITRRCGLHAAFFYEYSVNMHYTPPFCPHISVHHATSLHCVECTKQVLFDYATSIRFVE